MASSGPGEISVAARRTSPATRRLYEEGSSNRPIRGFRGTTLLLEKFAKGGESYGVSDADYHGYRLRGFRGSDRRRGGRGGFPLCPLPRPSNKILNFRRGCEHRPTICSLSLPLALALSFSLSSEQDNTLIYNELRLRVSERPFSERLRERE